MGFAMGFGIAPVRKMKFLPQLELRCGEMPWWTKDMLHEFFSCQQYFDADGQDVEDRYLLEKC